MSRRRGNLGKSSEGEGEGTPAPTTGYRDYRTRTEEEQRAHPGPAGSDLKTGPAGFGNADRARPLTDGACQFLGPAGSYPCLFSSLPGGMLHAASRDLPCRRNCPVLVRCGPPAQTQLKEGQPAPNVELPATQIERAFPDKKGAKTPALKDLQGKKTLQRYWLFHPTSSATKNSTPSRPPLRPASISAARAARASATYSRNLCATPGTAPLCM